jgi:hypothetical protein
MRPAASRQKPPIVRHLKRKRTGSAIGRTTHSRHFG